MIYLLAQYAQTFLDEVRPKKRTPTQIQSPIEQNPENDVRCLIILNHSFIGFI
jgi:hypothetical protein